MWWEYNNKKRNYFDRGIRNYRDIHEWATITGFFMLMICMLFGFGICALTKQKLIGQMYLVCGIISLLIIVIHMALDD